MSFKTSGQAVSEMYKYLRSSAVFALTTNIFTKKRPLNFKGECLVINSLPITASQYQEGVLNVNYFVPNLTIGTNPVDKTQPDSVRLDLAERTLTEALKLVWTDKEYFFELEQTYQLENETFNEWYVNCRVKFRNQNI